MASCVSPSLQVFLSSCLCRAEAHTLEACVGASYPGSLASPTPMPTRRHYSTFPEPLSQSPTGFAHRLSPSSTPNWTLLQRAFFSVCPDFPKPCLSFSSCSIPVPGPICSSTGDQEIQISRSTHSPLNLCVLRLLLTRPADAERSPPGHITQSLAPQTHRHPQRLPSAHHGQHHTPSSLTEDESCFPTQAPSSLEPPLPSHL